MRVAPLPAAFIFLGIAAAGAIPEIAALHDIVPDSQYGQGGHDLRFPTATTLFPVPWATPPDVAEHTKHTVFSSGDSHHHTKSSKKGKHSHSMTSRGGKPTDVGSHTPPLPTASANDLHLHHGASHRSSKTTVHGHHSYTPTDSSDHSKYTGRPSRRPTDKTSGLDPTGTISIHKPTGGVA